LFRGVRAFLKLQPSPVPAPRVLVSDHFGDWDTVILECGMSHSAAR
jgi:hypothetical protein